MGPIWKQDACSSGRWFRSHLCQIPVVIEGLRYYLPIFSPQIVNADHCSVSDHTGILW